MLKILFIVPSFNVSKDTPFHSMMSAYKTAIHLSKQANVTVVTSGPRVYHEIINANLKVYYLKSILFKDPINYVIPLGLFRTVISLIKTEKPDIFLVNKFMFFNAFIIPLLRLLGKKVYVQVDAFPSIDWISRTWWIRPIMWLYLRIIGLPLLWLSNTVILFHEGMIPIAKQYKLNYRVIHNGVDLTEFAKAGIATEVIKKRADEIFVAYIGRLESMKGYDILLKAASDLLPKHPHVKLFMVGNIQDKKDIVQQYASSQIVFLGARHDIADILAGIDVFVLPSFSEGLSNSLMEAMAAGCACIATDTAGGNKILIENGKTGLLVPPGDVLALQEKLDYLINEATIRKGLGLKSQQKIKEQFNWEYITKQYLELFSTT